MEWMVNVLARGRISVPREWPIASELCYLAELVTVLENSLLYKVINYSFKLEKIASARQLDESGTFLHQLRREPQAFLLDMGRHPPRFHIYVLRVGTVSQL